ncbi:serine/threonine-protein kinase afc3 [Phtheirospermum japonicum]|uniref:Serine/threonine-protein kinase afc3 n=1 Tax=Phtheirospermum japonicum TaxID=374723 RepID=A0A830AZ74_9LAMI|nr:serine/threonine-protein kinase afc3 [Phtheirospermum japonicum]
MVEEDKERQTRKRRRLTWDVAPSGQPEGDQRGGEDNEARPPPAPVLRRHVSPPKRDDDRDGHYVFSLGENLTPRLTFFIFKPEFLNACSAYIVQIRYLARWVKVSGHVPADKKNLNIFIILLVSNQQIASAVGTFGRVLECWDRQTREQVAIKVVRSISKYRDAAMIEVDILQRLAKSDKDGSNCVKMHSWFDYRNHICIVFEKLGPSLFDFLKRNKYTPFPVDLVREFGRQLLESVACLAELELRRGGAAADLEGLVQTAHRWVLDVAHHPPEKGLFLARRNVDGVRQHALPILHGELLWRGGGGGSDLEGRRDGEEVGVSSSRGIGAGGSSGVVLPFGGEVRVRNRCHAGRVGGSAAAEG